MRVDISEIKVFRECKRKHKLSSRNGFHLRARATSPNLTFGILFHEALHGMYLGAPPEEMLDQYLPELGGDSKLERTFTNMIGGYACGPLVEDLEKYRVLDIEHRFSFKLPGEAMKEIEFCGSIDMIVVNKETNEVDGFEHKTCAKFRTDLYLWMDEQPRLYYYALGLIVDELNRNRGVDELLYTRGVLYVNEVQKLITKFEYCRRPCVYSEKDEKRFLEGIKASCKFMLAAKETGEEFPEPSYMKCQMCDYSSICEQYMYETLDLDNIKVEFEEEFLVRDVDHLEEKQERHGDTE